MQFLFEKQIFTQEQAIISQNVPRLLRKIKID